MVRHLRKYFPVYGGLFSRLKGYIRAVEDVSFSIPRGRTLGLVGESGCGKTTTGRALLRLIEPTSGEFLFHGESVFRLPREKLRRLRRKMQIIFQDPFSSLNPRKSVGSTIGEVLKIHRLGGGKERREMTEWVISKVGLLPSDIHRYPHEFSGGGRQRIAIARAIVLRPDFIVCDEPISALDVSIQAQIINLLKELQEELHLSYLFIAHDLHVVRHISDEVAVMYMGRIVERAEVEELFKGPLHPYSRALISAVPVPEPGKKGHRLILKGEIPSPQNPPTGCPFHTRCPEKDALCREVAPELKEVSRGHWVSCLRVG
ncbi:MAG TPA: ABC transporter ATP-binding protein [Candidatus Hypogeohydataceae bacterium YC38]